MIRKSGPPVLRQDHASRVTAAPDRKETAMARTLVVVAGVGLAVSAVCLTLAGALGGPDWRGDFVVWDLGAERCDRDSARTTRNLPWDGSDTIRINVPATIHYRRGAGDDVVADGPADVVDHLRVRDGRIDLECRNADRDDLTLTLPGRMFRHFTLAGSGMLMLQDIDQPRLELTLRGSGSVEASGAAPDTEVDISGSGDAKLAALKIMRLRLHINGSGDAEAAPEEDADVQINGSGEAHLAAAPVKRLRLRTNGSGDTEARPVDDADISINGSGRVRLLSRPHNLETDIRGSGRVITEPSAP
jgi:hypothetical protein